MTTHAPDEILLGFSRALRAAGVPVTQDRNLSFLVAATELGAGDPTHVRLAGHATLCAGPEDVARFDRVFDAWFNHREPALSAKEPPPAARTTIARLPDSESSGEGEEESDTIHALASDTEVLRHRDVAEMSPNEKHRLATMFATLRPRPPLRRTSRHRRWHRGEVDAHRTLRAMLRRMGEPGEIAHRRQARKPRRVVVLLDISGSMAAYAEAHLRLAHRIAQGGGPVEVFTVGTRLTRITRALRLRDPDRALAAAGDTVPDWSGGTRLGESLQAFLDRFGARGWLVARWSCWSATAGSAATRRCSPSRWPGWGGSRTVSCGSTRIVARWVMNPCNRGCSPRCRTSTTSWPDIHWRPSPS